MIRKVSSHHPQSIDPWSSCLCTYCHHEVRKIPLAMLFSYLSLVTPELDVRTSLSAFQKLPGLTWTNSSTISAASNPSSSASTSNSTAGHSHKDNTISSSYPSSYQLERYIKAPRRDEPYFPGERISQRNTALLQVLDEQIARYTSK